MSMPQPLLAEIDDPLERAGWRVSRPDDEGALHAQVLRELCDRGLPLHLGGCGMSGVAATLQLVDMVQQQLVLASHADGIAIARALQARPLWAAAHLDSLSVQFALAAPSAARIGTASAAEERFLIQARWPREIYRTSRRRALRQVPLAMAHRPEPVARIRPGHAAYPAYALHALHALASTRDLQVLDISELGCALLLPAGMVPPAAGSLLPQVELELDEAHIVCTDAVVMHVSPLHRRMHRIGCRWQDMPASEQRLLARWLAAASAAPRRRGSAPTPPVLEAAD